MGVFRDRRGRSRDRRHHRVRAIAREGARECGAAHDWRDRRRLRVHRVRSHLGEPSRSFVVRRAHRDGRPVLRRGTCAAWHFVGVSLQLLRRGAHRIDRAAVVCDLICRVLCAFGSEGSAVHGGGRRFARRVHVDRVPPALRPERLCRRGGHRRARPCRVAQAALSLRLPFRAVFPHLVPDRAVPRGVFSDDVRWALHALPCAVLHRGGARHRGVSYLYASDALLELHLPLSLVGAADDHRLRPSADRLGPSRAAQRCVRGQLHRHVRRPDVRVGCGDEICKAYRRVAVYPVRRLVCC